MTTKIDTFFETLGQEMGGSRTRRKSPIADARVLLKVDILRYVIDISIDDFERNRKNRMQIV